MKSFKEKLSVLTVGLLITTLFAGLYIAQPNTLKKIELLLYDALLSKVEQSEPSGLVTIVYIDEKSLTEVGQWPWPRYKFAELLNKIQQAPVLSVAIDFLLAEPDRTSLTNIAKDFQSTFTHSLPLVNIPSNLLNNDQILADVLASGPFVTGYSFTFEQTFHSIDKQASLHPLNLLYLYDEGIDKNHNGWYKANGVVESLKVFSTAVANSGFFNVTPESDGIIRKVPLIMQYQDNLYPSLSLATVMNALQAQQLVLKTSTHGLDSLLLDEQSLPLDRQGNFWVHFRTSNEPVFQSISATDIINNRIPPESFENQIVLLGSSAKGLHDLRSTPYDPIMPGVDIHATIIDNIIRGDFIHHPNWSWSAQLVLMLILGITSVIIISWSKASYSFLLNMCLIGLLFYASWWWLQNDRVYLSVFYPVILVITNLGILTILQSRFKEKKLLQQTLEHNIQQQVVLEKLTKTKNELEVLSNSLEQQVVERTQSLFESNKKLSDSINYASLIQHALIPQQELFDGYFKDSFVIWQPKDVVGGDIYLFDTLRNPEESLLMVIDCTGHGVPGAFVTMLVKAIEREILANINDSNLIVSPAEILSYFNKGIKKLLKQESAESISDAGFDGGILYYNRKQQEMKFAGATTNLYIIENNNINIIKGNKHSIGYKNSIADYKFKDNLITPQPEMQIYITTDGFLDQKGGEKGFCLGRKRFQNLLSLCDNKPMVEQKNIFLKELVEYQATYERNDDVTVIGMKI